MRQLRPPGYPISLELAGNGCQQAEIQSLTRWLKEELQREYNRMLPARVQKSVTTFELSIYSPTIEGAWKGSGISRLKIDGIPDQRWQEPLEAVVYKAGKYLC